MRVEITEDSLVDRNPDDDRVYQHVKGDILTVPDHLGQYWVDLGWAKDVDGVHPTGERIPGPHPHIQHLYRRHDKNYGNPPEHIRHLVHTTLKGDLEEIGRIRRAKAELDVQDHSIGGR